MTGKKTKVVESLMKGKHLEDLKALKITENQFRLMDMFFRVKPMMFFIRLDEVCITEALQEPFITFSYAHSIAKEFVHYGLLVSKKQGRRVIYRHTPRGKKLKEAVELVLDIGAKVIQNQLAGQSLPKGTR